MELVNKGGFTYFVPVSDREGIAGGINSFAKWEQVFRVYSNIYTHYYPDKASELIQYNHIIYTASQSFSWENVYLYDCEFRMHLSNYLQRSWAIILQQAWSMCLKDKLSGAQDFRGYGGSNNGGSRRGKKEPCHRFNKGLCMAGTSCKYDHRCTVKTCGKWGHGTHICHKCLSEEGGSSPQNQQNASNQSVVKK